MGFDTIKLEKGMYRESGKSFTQVLEQLDPSESYKGTALEGTDAFQRQLKRFDVRAKGAYSDPVEKFFRTMESSVLFPEYIARAVRQGMEENNVLPKITATTTTIDSMDYRSVYSVPSEEDKKLMQVAEGASIPATEVKTKSKECDRLALSAKNMGRILEYNTEEAKKKALINERLSEEGKSLREEKERLRNDILGLTTQKEEIGSEAESLADVVQAARSDLFHLNAQKIAVSGEILNLNQERDKAQREAEEAKAQKRTAEAEAAEGLAVGAAKKLGNVLGFGSEAKQLKELPQKLEEARTEGEKAAVTKILDVARLNFGDKEVTPEMIGKAWRSKWDEAKNARAETERQVKNATAHASGLEKILDAFLAIPIIRACVHAIVSFVRQGRRSFSTEDTAILKTALGGDPDNAAALRKIAYYHGGAYAQPHLSSYWDRAEMCMQKIARGENQEQDQNISQGRRWHL